MLYVRRLVTLLMSFALLFGGAAALQAQSSSRSPQEQKTGDQNHPRVLARQGGAISNRQVSRYVDTVGRKLVRHSAQPGAKWVFTVLDTPIVNAFALPGGYVYVSR
ncbi:MAG: M48 family metalloprotease, partial [Halocynthiibacter sp.]